MTAGLKAAHAHGDPAMGGICSMNYCVTFHTLRLILTKSIYVFCLQEQSQLPATLLLAQHKVRAAQLETQIEQQKQNVKPTSLFSTGIHMVSATVIL